MDTENELTNFIRKSTKEVVPHFKRVQRAFETAAKSEIKNYLRENGITQELLSDKEFEKLVDILESKKYENVAPFCKEYSYRQLRRIHNPSKTAYYLQYSFQETLLYLSFLLFYMILIFVSIRKSYSWIVQIFIRLLMTFHLGYYNILWLRRILITVYLKSKEFVLFTTNILKILPAIFFETVQVLFEVFVGWYLFISIISIFLVTYIIPMLIPEMGLFSVFYEIYFCLSEYK